MLKIELCVDYLLHCIKVIKKGLNENYKCKNLNYVHPGIHKHKN